MYSKEIKQYKTYLTNLLWSVRSLYKYLSKLMKWVDNNSFNQSHKSNIVINNKNKDSHQTHCSPYGIFINREYYLWPKMITIEHITHIRNYVTKKQDYIISKITVDNSFFKSIYIENIISDVTLVPFVHRIVN